MLPVFTCAKKLATRFNDFFVTKIVRIRNDLKENNLSHTAIGHTAVQNSPKPSPLLNFVPVTQEEVKKIIMNSKSTTCPLDPLPTTIVKQCIDALLPVITSIVNSSLSQGIMPSQLKKALVTPLLKKLNLLLEVFKNYRPISNLAYISKVIERVVAKRCNTITHGYQ